MLRLGTQPKQLGFTENIINGRTLSVAGKCASIPACVVSLLLAAWARQPSGDVALR